MFCAGEKGASLHSMYMISIFMQLWQQEPGIKVLNNKIASNGKFSFDLLYSYPVWIMLKIKGMFLRELMHDKLTKGYFIGMLCRVSRS